MSVMMQISGIEGESQMTGHAGWMALTSFQWGGRRALRTHTGGGYGISAVYSAPQLSSVVVTRLADSASAMLWNAMRRGDPAPAKFHWLRPGPGGDPVTYLEAEFEDARIVSIMTNSSGGRPTETLTITYDALEFRVANIGNALSGAQDVVSHKLGQ